MTDNRKYILHADDNLPIRRIIERFVEKRFPDYEYVSFEDGTSLANRLDQGVEGVDLVVTDNDMPRTTGSELIRKYSSMLRKNGIPIILLGGDEEIGKKALQYGAFEAMTKPVTLDELYVVFKGALEFSNVLDRVPIKS